MSGYTFRFKRSFPPYCCQFCGKPVGYFGVWLAWLFGLRVHGCDHSNVEPPI